MIQCDVAKTYQTLIKILREAKSYEHGEKKHASKGTWECASIKIMLVFLVIFRKKGGTRRVPRKKNALKSAEDSSQT